MADTIKELVIRIRVENQQAIEQADQLRSSADELRTQLKQLASDSKRSFSDLAAGMKRAKFDEIFSPESFEKYRKAILDGMDEISASQIKQAELNKRTAQMQKTEWNKWSEALSVANKQVREELKQTEDRIKRMADQSKISFREAGEEMKRLGANAQMVDESVANLEQKAQEAGKGFDFFGIKIKNLGDIVSLVFGTSIAMIAINALKDLVGWLKEAAQVGVEFSRSIYTLSVSVRALQRRGMDITFEEALKMAQELQQTFGVFSFQSMVEGIGQLQLLTRNANLTKEQLMDLARVAGSLSVLLGKDFNEAAREIGLYLSSGYAESLQRAGIMVSKMTIEQEAMADGVFKSYRQLTDQERALYGYQAIMRQATDTIEDAAGWQEQLGGEVEKASARIDNAMLSIGRSLAPAVAAWAKFKADIVDGVDVVIKAFRMLGLVFTVQGGAILQVINELKDGSLEFSKAWERFSELSIGGLKEGLWEILGGIEDPIDRALGAAVGAVDDGAMNLQEALSNLADTIVDEMIKGKQRIRDAGIDLARDLEVIDRKEIDKLSDLWDDYLRNRDEKILKAEQRVAQEIEKYNLDRTQIIRQYNQKIEEAQEDYRQKEVDAEEKFQEKLRQLRENFLLSLEDAVRARDAYQIARLKRKFQMDSGRLKREAAQEKEARKRAFEDQKKDLEAQRAERLRTLEEDHNLRLKQIEDNKNSELELLREKYDQEVEDQKKAFERQRREREIRYQEELDDIERQAVDRIEQMAQKLDEEGTMVETKLEAEAGTWENIFGQDGEIEQSIYYFFGLLDELQNKVSNLDLDVSPVVSPEVGETDWYDWRAAGGGSDLKTYVVKAGDTLSAIAQKFRVTIDSIVDLNRLPDPDKIYPGQKLVIPKAQFAEGGTLIARKPTMAIFGESGSEVASFSPLNRLGANENRIFGGYMPGGSSGGEKHEVLISLGNDLEGRIINTALNEVSSVFIKVQKATRRR